jgi:hypothetical protein
MVTAYQSVLEAMMALPREHLITINLDITAAAGVALAVARRLPQHRPEVEKHLATLIDLPAFDQLGTYALALMQADALVRSESRASSDLPALAARGAHLRQQMVLDARALAFKGLIDGASLDHLKGASGYDNLAVDLTTLSALLRQNWDQIRNSCTSDLSDLIEAAEIGLRIVQVKGIRDLQPRSPSAAREIRRRAFTLFMHAYDEVRRAITCLRWQARDANKIVPSLFAGRSNGRGNGKARHEQPSVVAGATPTQPGAPAPADPPMSPGIPGRNRSPRNALLAGTERPPLRRVPYRRAVDSRRRRRPSAGMDCTLGAATGRPDLAPG